jgi:hypothetical protein
MQMLVMLLELDSQQKVSKVLVKFPFGNGTYRLDLVLMINKTQPSYSAMLRYISG